MAVVRYAEPADGPSMGDIHVRAWQVAYRGLMLDSHLDGLDAGFRAERWTAALQFGRGAGECVTDEGTTTAMVIEDGGAIGGIAAVNRAHDTSAAVPPLGEVAMINVAPERWGSGLGRQLLTACIDELRWQGCSEAILWVLDSNRRARAFYERAGWQADGATKQDDDRGFPVCQVRYRRPVDTSDDDFRLGPTADVDAVLGLYEEAAQWLTARGIDQWSPGGLPAERVQQLLDQGEATAVFAGGRMVACCILVQADNAGGGHVHDLIVARSHAGQGLGRRLLQRAERRVAERGGTKVHLDCVTTNTGLRRYYERAGYRHVGETDFGRPDWTPCAVYEKELRTTAGRGPTA